MENAGSVGVSFVSNPEPSAISVKQAGVPSVAVPKVGGAQHGIQWVTEHFAESAYLHYARQSAGTARITIGPVAEYFLVRAETLAIHVNISILTASSAPSSLRRGASDNSNVNSTEILLFINPDIDRVSEMHGTISSIAGAAQVASLTLLSGAAVAHAQQLHLYAVDTCFNANTDLGRALHPLGVFPAFQEVDGSRCLGLVLGNAVLCVAVLAVHYALCRAAPHIEANPFKRCATSIAQRFPGVPLFVALFAYQGTALCSVRLAVYPMKASHCIIGLAFCVFLIAGPVWLARTLRAAVPRLALYHIESGGSVEGSFFLGEGSWVSTSRMEFARRWSVVLRPYTEQRCCAVVFECLQMFLVGCILATDQASSSYQGCGVARLLCAFVHAAGIAFLCRHTPFTRARDTYTEGLRLLLQSASLLFMAISYFEEDPSSAVMSAASRGLMCAAVVLLLKVLLDGICFMYIYAVNCNEVPLDGATHCDTRSLLSDNYEARRQQDTQKNLPLKQYDDNVSSHLPTSPLSDLENIPPGYTPASQILGGDNEAEEPPPGVSISRGSSVRRGSLTLSEQSAVPCLQGRPLALDPLLCLQGGYGGGGGLSPCIVSPLSPDIQIPTLDLSGVRTFASLVSGAEGGEGERGEDEFQQRRTVSVTSV